MRDEEHDEPLGGTVLAGGVCCLVGGLLLVVDPWRTGEWFIQQKPGAVPAGVSARFVARRFGIVTLWVGGGLVTAWGPQALKADRSLITALMPVAFVTGLVLLGWTLHGLHVSEAGRTDGSDAEQPRDG
ncbi:hypothetical protein [Streptomyces sp. NPDC006274]|uniref:hypothetical protein n=1 Tax=unclassified Streptomyces TaxID=2593676 RepID=UPI0033B2126C